MAIVAVAALLLAGCTGDDSSTTTEDRATTPAPHPPTAEATPTPSPTSTPEPEPREFTLVATGDVLLHERLWVQAQRDADPDGTWNFAPQLRHVEPIVSAADLALCHLEVPLAEDDHLGEGYPTFAGPPSIVPALAETGYTACSTASNHIFDQGAAGVDRTLDGLDEYGIAHAGAARTEAEATEPTIVQIDVGDDTIDIGLISYTYGFNGIPYPNGDEWRSNLIDEDDILADAAAARDAGADVVVVSMHWGDEYVHEPNQQQLDLAPTLIGSPDIDVLLGHHAHVVQPMENVDGQWIVYGMGNFMANHAQPQGPRSEGLLVRLTFTEDLDDGTFHTSAAEYLPLYQTYEPPVEVLHVPEALASGETGTAGRARLEEALERTVDVVESRGGADEGLVMIDAD